MDTSAIYSLHGHSLTKRAVAETLGNGNREVSKFIRMEYIRSLVIPMIELYFLIKESESVRDALIEWSQAFSPRRLKIVLVTITEWIASEEGSQNKATTLRRLGRELVSRMRDFDHTFPIQHDPLSCELGSLSFPRQLFHEEMLRDFKENFDRIFHGTPRCGLCQFRARQIQDLKAKGVDLYSEEQRRKYKRNRGYVRQATHIEKAVATTEKQPSCRWCEKLGDTIIALHFPQEAVLVTGDQVFAPLAERLGKAIRFIPPLAQLKKQLMEAS
jgi:hypothetical protein